MPRFRFSSPGSGPNQIVNSVRAKSSPGTVPRTVPGDDFARTLFTIWFGPEPGDENLKRGMLGKGSAS